MFPTRNKRLLAAMVLLVALSTSCIEYNRYYVSPAGNDNTGDGSQARPWQTIQYAVDHIDYSKGNPLLKVAAGTYQEKLTIRQSVYIEGQGVSQTVIRNTKDDDYVVTIQGTQASLALAVGVRLEGLKIDGGRATNPGIRVVKAILWTEEIEVFGPKGYGIVIEESPLFSIAKSTVNTGGSGSDIGISIQKSTGTISDFSAGSKIDHIIDIGADSTVTIKDSQLTGHTLWYADGIRIVGISSVEIANTNITRPANAETPAPGQMHNPPYAGIEVGFPRMPGNQNKTVKIENCTISGFDVGIGVSMDGNGIMIQGNKISGRTASVETFWPYAAYPDVDYPVVDLGGGTLNSKGGNTLGTADKYAFRHGAPYDVAAYHNSWGSAGTDVERRIWDKLDDPKLGRISH